MISRSSPRSTSFPPTAERMRSTHGTAMVIRWQLSDFPGVEALPSREPISRRSEAASGPDCPGPAVDTWSWGGCRRRLRAASVRLLARPPTVRPASVRCEHGPGSPPSSSSYPATSFPQAVNESGRNRAEFHRGHRSGKAGAVMATTDRRPCSASPCRFVEKPRNIPILLSLRR